VAADREASARGVCEDVLLELADRWRWLESGQRVRPAPWSSASSPSAVPASMARRSRA